MSSQIPERSGQVACRYADGQTPGVLSRIGNPENRGSSAVSAISDNTGGLVGHGGYRTPRGYIPTMQLHGVAHNPTGDARRALTSTKVSPQLMSRLWQGYSVERLRAAEDHPGDRCQ